MDQIVAAIHEAFSLAIADTFWFGLAATLVALIVVTLGLRDVELLGRVGARVPGEEPVAGEEAVATAGPVLSEG